MATDALGQQVLSKPVKLRVDGEPPLVRVSGPERPRAGSRSGSATPTRASRRRLTRVHFGDGAEERGGAKLRHRFERPGRYRIVVHARDRVGNRVTRRFQVRVR